MAPLSASPHPSIETPSPWVARFLPLIPQEGEVLDLACGSGRHARLLHGAGYQVLAVDRNLTALSALSADGIATMQIDLEAISNGRPQWPFSPRRFAAVVVTNYLFRPLLPLLTDSIADGGVLLYETFSVGNEHFGKPSNPDFLLRPGELLDVARDASPSPLRVIAYECGRVDSPRPAVVQRISAIRPPTAVVPTLPAP